MTKNEKLDEKWYHWQVKDTEYTRPDEDKPALDIALPHNAKLSPTGLVLPKIEDEDDELDEKQWRDIGEKLNEIDSGVQWAYGDWWAFGHKGYGKRAALIARDVFPYEFGSLMNLGRVARKVPTSLRNEALTFAHHVAVAKLHPHTELQKDWLDKALRKDWNAKELDKEIREQEKADRSKDDEASEEKDPEAYRVVQSRKTALDALHRFDKIGKTDASLESVVQAITTDQQVVKDLDDLTIARLIRAATNIVDMFREVVTVLKHDQERRAKAADEPADEAEEEEDKPADEPEEEEASKEAEVQPEKKSVGRRVKKSSKRLRLEDKPVKQKRPTKKAA
jgi:hypothetical protein